MSYRLFSWSVNLQIICKHWCKNCCLSWFTWFRTHEGFPHRRSPSLGQSWAVCCQGRWSSSRDQCRLMLTGDPPVSNITPTWWSQVKLHPCALCAVLQVPGRLHVWQQREAEGRRGVSLQPEVPEVAVHRVQHAAEGALGPGGDPAPDAVYCRSCIRIHRPRPERPVQGETSCCNDISQKIHRGLYVYLMEEKFPLTLNTSPDEFNTFCLSTDRKYCHWWLWTSLQ